MYVVLETSVFCTVTEDQSLLPCDSGIVADKMPTDMLK